MTEIIAADFYNREVVTVARDLLGLRLVRRWQGQRLSGVIIETEAYRGEDDLACHAHRGQTKRNAVMYGPPGHAYIYFTYGMHWCLNCVTGPAGYPAAVLIRALLPVEGLEQIAAHRAGVKPALWCAGPARLTRALAIDGALNGCDLTSPPGDLWIESAALPATAEIVTGPRVGINYAPEPWRSMEWNFKLVEVHP
ncbi:MAG TPA: DNA-3-methyladenine glycosylase [Anaerolineaceae bacterium]|nr:DNA-3-methyladenine glycosylase [Anaerolineaceae bacterium]HOG78836.1 DNA-3-methyladenine glycosylase [Anaerolineaceae bacterium]